ncbi:MAG: TolC family protein [Rhodocyclaceae bacterium]|nr:TolC family protein [Rhodocyclaceae bacterium]
MKRLVLLMTAILLAAGPAAAEAIPGASVDSLLVLAKARNPDLAVARLEAEAAAERVQPAGALPDPVLRVELENLTNGGNTGLNLSPSRVGDTKYSFIQSLPFPGKRDLRRDVAGAEADQASRRADEAWLDLSGRIKSAYADWWLNGRNSALNRELLELIGNIEKVAQVRYAAGLAPQQDAIRAQVERTGLLTDGLMLEHERHTLSALINGLLARPANAPLEAGKLLRPLPPGARTTPEALGARLTVANPGLAAEESRIAGARAGRDLAYRERYPDFAMGVVPMQMGNSVSSWSVMLEVNLPLQQESRRSRERESERMLAAAEAKKAGLANRLRSELENAQAALDVGRETEMLISGSLLPQAELGFKAALAGYEAGKLDFATLLDAQRQVKLARQGLYKAQAGQRARLADIERLIGEEL